MADMNVFLRADWQTQKKGGLRTIEDQLSVENFAIQTRGGALDPFEDRLADDLMKVFGSDVEELEDVVAGLNAIGSHDRDGQAWTDLSFQVEMSNLALMLFATNGEVAA